MARPIVTVPLDLLRVVNFAWKPDWRGQGVGDTTDGVSQTVVNAIPRWLGAPQLHLDRRHILRWRAVRGAAQGRVGLYLLEMFDPLTDLAPPPADGIPFSTGAPFATGVGFASAPAYIAVGDAARGAEELVIDVPEGLPAPVAGQFLSHAHWPFQVIWADLVSASRWRIGIVFPLRAAIGDGDGIELRAKGIFEDADGSGDPDFGTDLVSRPQLSLREWINR